MGTRRKPKTTGKPKSNELPVEKQSGEPIGQTLARVALDPLARHANLASAYAERAFTGEQRPAMPDYVAVMGDELERAGGGDLNLASRLLASQAMSLDAIFTEMARRSLITAIR